MPPLGCAADRGVHAQSFEPAPPRPDHEDGLEIDTIDRWKTTVREFIKSSLCAEGDVKAKSEIYEYLADKWNSLRSLLLVAI